MKKVINFLIFFVCLCLPLYIWRFKIFAIPTTFLEILIIFTFLLWFLIKVLREKNVGKIFDFEDSKAIIFFLAVFVMATVFSFDQRGGLGILKAYFIEPVLLFLVICNQLKNGVAKFAFSGLVIATFWLSGLAIFQKITGLGIPGDAVNEIAQDRIVGVYNSANSLALFIGPVFALSFGWFLSQLKTRKLNNSFFLGLAGLGLLVQVITIILTKSGGGILALAGVIVFLILSNFLSFKKSVWLFISIFVLGSFVTFLLPILAFLKINLGQIFSDVTLANRFFLWEGTMRLVLDKPLFGAGLNGFRELYGANYVSPVYDELLQYPHNLILNFWAESGVFGVVAFYWVLATFTKKAAGSKMFGFGLLGVILYIGIHGVFDVPYFKNDLSAQFFILLALAEFRTLDSASGNRFGKSLS